MSKIFDFSGGMNNVTPPHLLSDSQAEEILNAYLDKSGVWKDINIHEVLLDLSATYFAGAVKVCQWKPTHVPADCVDDFVYVVFYSDQSVKMVYRGAVSDTVCTILLKAMIYGTTTYLALSITSITADIDGASTSGTTSATAAGGVSRRYYLGTVIAATAPATATSGEYSLGFYRWCDISAALVDTDRVLAHTMAATLTLIAEYVILPYVRIEDSSGTPIASLPAFYAMGAESSEVQSYFTGGIGLDDDLLIYPPENFEISLDETTWVEYGSAITIDKATANAGMTEIFARYIGVGS